MLKCPCCYKEIAEGRVLETRGIKIVCPNCDHADYNTNFNQPNNANDQVNSPQHYADHYPFEVCEAIKLLMDNFCEGMEAYDCYCLGNELKYRLRAGFKDEGKILEDIQKSIWYNKERREG